MCWVPDNLVPHVKWLASCVRTGYLWMGHGIPFRISYNYGNDSDPPNGVILLNLGAMNGKVVYILIHFVSLN